MTAHKYTVQWSPQAHPHVVGRYTARVPGQSQFYEVECTKCGAKWGPVKCDSGMVRRHIANFAASHIHRDALQDPIEKIARAQGRR